jgi:hypothetical protein
VDSSGGCAVREEVEPSGRGRGAMDELQLEVAEFRDLDHWRWRLTDAGGAFLAGHLARAVAACEGEAELQAFFRDGESRPPAEAFLAALAGWTRGLADALQPAARTLFFVLCALEEEDRQGGWWRVRGGISGAVWRSRGRCRPWRRPSFPSSRSS